MPYLAKDDRTWFQILCSNIISQGPIPKHVGLILDGSRRFARHLGKPTLEGHKEGYITFKKAARLSMDLGVEELTAYIFSYENFKRSKEEVDGIMKILEEGIMEMLENKDELINEGVCYQFIGDWQLASPLLKKIIPQIMIATRYNTKARVNMAFIYTARNEISRGVESIHKGVQKGDLLADDINEDLLSQSFHIIPSLPVDMIIRTSGEKRLSDFLLWQSTDAVIHFDDVLWPDFKFWNLAFAVLEYQRNHFAMNKLQLKSENENVFDPEAQKRRQKFISKSRDEKWKELETQANAQ